MDDEREQLYQQFRALAGSPSITEFFDEDDLVDIYDYANDINDDFVKMEVLFYGARVHPDSDALAIRRNYLYYYLGNDAGAKAMLDKRNKPTTLSRLLELRQRVDRGESIIDGVNHVLSRAQKLDDEEVIQLVNEAQTIEHYEWVKRNLHRIKPKCSYLPTLYYELASVAQDHDDNEFALEMAEELTALEPFNLEFWEMLAELQYGAERFDQCLATVEFALAIDPESPKAITLKAMSLMALNERRDEALRLLLSVSDSDDFESQGMQAIATLYLTGAAGDSPQEGRDKAVAYLRKCLERSPGCATALESLLALDEAHFDDYVEALHSSSFPDDEDFWAPWAARLLKEGNPRAAALLMSESYSRNGNPNHFNLFVEALYRAGFHDTIVLHLNNRLSVANASADLVDIPAECFLMCILAMARMGKIEEARNMLTYTRSLPEEAMVPPNQFAATLGRVHALGYHAALDRISAALEASPMRPVDEWDPLSPDTSPNNSPTDK